MKASSKSLITLALLACGVGLEPAAPAHVAPVRASKAIVVSVRETAARAGLEVLQQAGNAVDAAVATGFALAVVHPQAGNLGGGGFLLLRWADGTAGFLDFREKAPAAATRNMYLDKHGQPVEDMSTLGYKAIAVPGSVAGLTYAQKKWGKLPLQQVMAPAIRLAQEGFELLSDDARDFRDPDLVRFPESRRIFQRDGRYYQAGEVFRQPELVHTLERIAADPESFYRGALAHELAAAVQKGGGLITAADLAAYQVKEREPIRGSYRGYRILSAPPPSSGGVALLEVLNILEGYDLGKLGAGSAEAIHLVSEAYRRAFFDRAAFLGDPDAAEIPVAELTAKEYAAAWRRSVEEGHATISAKLARPAGFGELDRLAGVAPPRESDHTTHYSVVDAEGNAVAVTTTLNDSFGSRVTAEGLGFLLNDEMDDFAAKPGSPNMYGLIQGEANAVGPGKRPLSSMAPTIVEKDGKLFLVVGSPGGPRIISTVANILIGVIDFGLNIQEAVNAPRFHHQWLPDQIRVEEVGLSPDTLGLLEQKGHTIERTPYWSDGECIQIDLATGERLGATDPRVSGGAVGY